MSSVRGELRAQSVTITLGVNSVEASRRGVESPSDVADVRARRPLIDEPTAEPLL